MDTAPIILLYRQAMEVQLRELVGEGCSLLQNPVDRLTLYKATFPAVACLDRVPDH